MPGGLMVKTQLIVLLVCFSLGAMASSLPAAEPTPAPDVKQTASSDKSVAEITELAKKSVVVITVAGRDGQRHGIGSGFVIGADGLIATNLHVIGEARPIDVQFSDGQTAKVTSIHASDRHADLAILKVDAKDLAPLPLGDAEKLKQGEDVLALGNPLGLKLSVVTGVVSALREVEGRSMIQIAMPIEQGNSGGPLLDRQGRVQGIITLKSLRSPNLGFAVTVNQLRPLMEHPNSITMQRWLTIGMLDPKNWKTVFGSHWWQRAGRLRVDGTGDGFGGRSLCLSTQKPEKLPVEVAAFVKLDQESGAAGLAFHADGERHFGFYPSAGKIRLTRFDGPDVLQWHVLQEISTPHYVPGEWNYLKVRLEEGRIVGYVNNQQVVDYKDSTYSAGMVGLAKFRDTVAEFKSFQVAASISPRMENTKLQTELNELKQDRRTPKASSPSHPRRSRIPKGSSYCGNRRERWERWQYRFMTLPANCMNAGCPGGTQEPPSTRNSDG
ncbi:MAG: trypsin-like peptidase domain-containing protein [Planctomycetales bacterium]